MSKRKFSDYGGEIGITLLVVAVIALMILPLPTMVIDTLLGINITLSVILLSVAMYMPSIVSLSSFPSLLLFTTLFRLSLNIASTKSILLNADAGHIIESFGELVVGGNLVVGLVVFLIIATVQFIVIAKGSERVAEVSARFTLDAMPGKQMSIDSDLRAGNITAEDAREKRAMLAMESQLHGGMDGAMKFVKGDAIAGLVITLVNILAGIVIGISYHGMSAGEAANRFSVLSIGDAMVSQIPSLLISVAAGILITRVADERPNTSAALGAEMFKQLAGNSSALFIAASLLIGFAFVPGFPSWLFVILSAIVAIGGFRLKNANKKDKSGIPALQREGGKGAAPSIGDEAPHFSCPLAIRLSEGLSRKLDNERLSKAFVKERQGLVEELGLPFPGISMWKSDKLSGLSYEILILDVPAGQSELPEGRILVENAGEALLQRAEALENIAGMETSHWIGPDALAALAGATVVPTDKIIARHAVNQLRQNAHLFMGVQEAQWILERITTDYPSLVAEAQKALPPQKIAEVLRRLLEEQVPIRNIKTILESIIVWGPKEKDLLMLTEYVRGDLGRMIAHKATAGKGLLPTIMLDQSVEQTIRQAIKQTPAGNFLALPPDQVNAIISRLDGMVNSADLAEGGPGVAVVTAMDIRRYFRRMIERRLPDVGVYSFQELAGGVELDPVGKLMV